MRLTLACLTVSIATTSASAAFALGSLNLKGGASLVARWPTAMSGSLGLLAILEMLMNPNYVLKAWKSAEMYIAVQVRKKNSMP